MAYDKAVLFKCYKRLNNYKDTVTYKFNNCDWGWFVEDHELEEFIDLGELEYKKELSPLETLMRFENNYTSFLNQKKINLENIKNLFHKYNEEHFKISFKNLYRDFSSFENLIYDKRVIKVIFHKYWWESGLN